MRPRYALLVLIGGIALAPPSFACSSAAFPFADVLFGTSEALQSGLADSIEEDGGIDALLRHGGVFPVVYGKYCTFLMAGDSDDGLGQMPGDLGNGLVGQIVYSSIDGCNPISHLVVSDCTQNEFAILEGSYRPSAIPENGEAPVVAGVIDQTIEHALAPEGPIDIQSFETISDAKNSAEYNNLSITTAENLSEFFTEHFDGDQFNTMCGCKIYYPDSAGAKL